MYSRISTKIKQRKKVEFKRNITLFVRDAKTITIGEIVKDYR
jgi:hypothetical protein